MRSLLRLLLFREHPAATKEAEKQRCSARIEAQKLNGAASSLLKTVEELNRQLEGNTHGAGSKPSS